MRTKIIAIVSLGVITLFIFQNCVFAKPAILALHSPLSSATETSAGTMTGINLNANIENLNMTDSENNGIVWHRGFFYMFDYMALLKARQVGFVPAKSIEAITADRIQRFQSLQKKSRVRTIVTLKWNFFDAERGLRLRIPQPDSLEEKQYFSAARSMIDEIGEMANIIVVGNEPANETQVEDLQNIAQPDGTEPNLTVRFYRRLAWNLHLHLVGKQMRNDKLLLLGSLTNVLDGTDPYRMQFLKRAIYVASTEPYIDGLDIHIHVADLNIYQKNLEKLRTTYNFTKKITVTEYSLITSFRKNLSSPLCQSGDAAIQFCGKYRLPDMRELDYLNMAVCRGPQPVNSCRLQPLNGKLPTPIQPAEWADFFRSRSYLPPHFLAEADRLNNQYGVSVATYSGYSFLGQLLVDPNQSITPGATPKPVPIPWAYNGIFSKNILAPMLNGGSQVNDYFMDDFKDLLKGP